MEETRKLPTCATAPVSMNLTMAPTSSSLKPTLPSRRVALVEALRARLLRPGRHWVLVSVAMYALACSLPAVRGWGEFPLRGYVCLIAVNDPIIQVYKLPYWWANPVYFVAVIASLLNGRRIAVFFAVVAALLAVSYELMAFHYGGIPGVMEVPLPGCLMWIASLQLLASHELWQQWLDWQRRQERPERGPDKSV